MPSKRFKQKASYIAVLACISMICTGHAATYTETVNLGKTELKNGDVIDINSTETSGDKLFGMSGLTNSTYSVLLNKDESLRVKVNSQYREAIGVRITNNHYIFGTGENGWPEWTGEILPNDFGTGSTINVTSGTKATGIWADAGGNGGATIKGAGMIVFVEGRQEATGLLSYASWGGYGNGQFDLEGSHISAKSDEVANAVLISDQSTREKDNNHKFKDISLHADAKVANGISINTNSNTFIDKGSITVADTANNADKGSGIYINSSRPDENLDHSRVNVTANELIIIGMGENRKGITVENTSPGEYYHSGNISLGSDSTIMTYDKGATGIAVSDGSRFNISADNFIIYTMGESANLVEAHDGQFTFGEGSLFISEKAGGFLALGANEHFKDAGDTATPSISIAGSDIAVNTFGARAQGYGASIHLTESTLTAGTDSALHALDGGIISVSDSKVIALQGTGLAATGGGQASFSGSSSISASGGALRAEGEESQITGSGRAFIHGDVTALDRGTIDLNLTDKSLITGGKIQSDENSAVNVHLAGNSVWSPAADSVVDGLTLDNSSLYIAGGPQQRDSQPTGRQVTVKGDYSGNNGHLFFNTVLGNDSSLTDKLTVNGNTSGTSWVSVNNLGGQGAETTEGIELIHVAGQSDGEFNQQGRIVAGAYDYYLVRGQGGDANNWYLSSHKTILTEPIEPTDPSMPEIIPEIKDPIEPMDPSMPEVTPEIKDPIEPMDPSMPEVTPEIKDPIEPMDPSMPEVDPAKPQPPASGESVKRPEGGSYVANMAAANTLFNTSLHDRLGETQYIDALTGEARVTSLWLRQVGSHNRWRDGSGQLKTQSNSYVVQLGGDVAQWSTNGLNRGHVGMMAGYANSHSRTHSSATGYHSRGSINGYSAGLYGTWFARDADKTGLYIDSWLQYSWFNNQVNGEKLASESYKSKGFTASLETGYTLKLGEFSGSHGTVNMWFIQPQAQVTWMGVKADKHREDNGTRVRSEGDGNIETRLGIRSYLQGHAQTDDDKTRAFQPFIEANWLHNTRSFSVKMDDRSISQAGARNLGEVKIGAEGQWNRNVNLWGHIGTQIGDRGYSNTAAMLGVKVNFK